MKVSIYIQRIFRDFQILGITPEAIIFTYSGQYDVQSNKDLAIANLGIKKQYFHSTMISKL